MLAGNLRRMTIMRMMCLSDNRRAGQSARIPGVQMNDDIKEQILSLKRSGRGYKTISRVTGVNLNTVKSLCRRSRLFRDNPEHRAIFTIPESKFSTELVMVKPLPPQQVITGHKQTDAYLWVLEVIKTGEPVHIAAAEAALEKLTITPKEAQERYARYWDWLSQMRVAAYKELHPNEYAWESSHIWHRENWLEKQLETIRPISSEEALNVLKWYLESENFADMGRRQDGVYLNLIGSHQGD